MAKPKLRFPGFTEDWEQRELSSLSELITKGTSPLSKRNDGDINFIKVENLDSFSGKILSCSKVSKEEHLTYLRRSILFKGDILFSIAGTLGRTAIVPEDILPANTNQALAIIRTKNQDLRFLLAALKSRTVTDFIKKNPTVGAQPNLSLAQVGSLKIPYPARAEQEKIGEFFSQLDTTITLHQRKVEKLKELKKGFLQKLFPKNGETRPELRFPGFTEDWEQRKLGDIATFINGRAYSQSELLLEGKYKVLRVGNFYTNDSWYYSDLELGEKYYANYGDLLYTWSATFGPHIWLGDKVIYHYHIWKIDLSDALEKHFAVQLLEQGNANILSNKNGSTMVHITKEGMEDKNVIIPSDVDEQAAIGQFFEQFDHLITLHQRKLEKLRELKKGFLQQMFV